jgi:hypothetical protein
MFIKKVLAEKNKETFTKEHLDKLRDEYGEHLDKLRDEYGKLDKIDPMSPTYKKLISFLDNLDKANLKLIADGKIKFLSMLANRRL